MRMLDLTMPLYEGMPGALLPTDIDFSLPFREPEKGSITGTETGTAMTLPSQFSAYLKTPRLHEIPLEKLMLRPTVVVSIPKQPGEEITASEVASALEDRNFETGDAFLLRTGWGDDQNYRLQGEAYVTKSPYFSLEGAEQLAAGLESRGCDLFLSDLALIHHPATHLIPEWATVRPVPRPWPSEAAQVYLSTYAEDRVKEDFAVLEAFARHNVMTVKGLVDCGQIEKGKVRIIVGPMHLVRQVGATARVVALED